MAVNKVRDFTCLNNDLLAKEKGGEKMRRILLMGLVSILLISMSSLVWANDLTLQEEVNVWKWTKNENTESWSWVLEPRGDIGANARAWQQGGILGGYCNKETWKLDVATHTSVAQWIRWQLSAQGWRIYVRKPGKYTGDCIVGAIKSNADVNVTFSGFGDLVNDRGEKIETFYSFGEELPEMITNWYPARTLDQQTLAVPYCEHNAHLWVMINVREDASDGYPKTRACEYQDDAQIKISVTVYKPWLDDDGYGLFE